jgi:PAS domain S-box-containing protein
MEGPILNTADALNSDRRFELLVQSIHDYAIFLLDSQGRVNSWNIGAQRMNGYTDAEIVGRHFSLFYTDAERAAGLPERVLRLVEEHGTYQAEGWRVRKDGSQFWASVVIRSILDESGTLIGFAKITRDITERKRAQDELEIRREAISQTQKLEAIGRITGGVAHDFNNLLTVIRLSAELLKSSGFAPEKRDRYIDAISDAAGRAALLTEQLLAFARQQPLRPEKFDAGQRIEEMKQLLETTLGTTIELNIDFPADLWIVEADANQFDTAILNMAVNARDAMERGGTLRISARNAEYLPPIRRHAGAVGNFAAITLSDTGTGIDASVIGRIFEPFFTTKATDKGTGLGLSQVYGFAKQSGGDIDVAADPGQGTTFTMYLPRAKPDEPAPPEQEATTQKRARQQQRVLLVEDNLEVGTFARDMLADLGNQVTWVTDGASALTTLHARNGGFDLVLSDVVMPGISGIELGKEVKRRWPGLRIVLTSGYSQVLAQGSGHGFEFLQKPYTAQGLIAILSDS